MRKSVAGTHLLGLEGTHLSFELSRSCEELQRLFREMKSPEDVSELLEVTHPSFNYWIYRTPESKRYTTFYISKKNGRRRRIDAPNQNVKILQQKLNQVLQLIYDTKPCVHGFAPCKSVRSNADAHSEKRWVFNIDLKDFFPSIHFGRVRGLFMGRPYNLPQSVATVLAHLCCFQASLPQGAPTSPVISNMICARMDSQLQQLARINRSTYTRYADDITFSTTTRKFPSDIGFIDRHGQLHPGDRLERTIVDNGFAINSRKIWLRGKTHRQVVTGVTVNEFPNLPRKYTNQIRAMLHAWKKHGLAAAQEEWQSKYDLKHRAPWLSTPQFKHVLKGKIEYLGMIKGQDSLTYLRFLDQLGELAPELTGGRGTPLRLLLHDYEALTDGSTTPQKRGILFEQLLNKLFKLGEIPVRESFRRNAGGEQIDGSFDLDGWYYLAECKWQATPSDQQQVDGLSGKVSRSGAQTMGMFVSVNGWSYHVVDLMKQNSEKRIFLMNGDDIRAVLSGQIPLADLLQAKIEALNTRSEPYLAYDEITSNKKN